MTLGCRAFFVEFLKEFEEERKKTKWEKLWNKNTKWTAKMLGTKLNRNKGDYGLVGRIAQKFHYEIDSEWRHTDQVWYFYLPSPKTWEDIPWKCDVLVEHENNIKRFEFTLFKFGEISAPLKIGIFYPEEDEEDYLKKASEIIRRQMISYPGEVYLIIFGFLNDDKGIYWHGYEIDIKGNIIKLHEH